MPGSVITADELPKLAPAADEKVRRNLHAANALKVSMRVPIQLVGEQTLNVVSAVLAWRQANGVDHDQID